MAVLNLADDVKLGSAQVDRVYLGTNLVWESAAAPASDFPFARRATPAATTAERWMPA